MKQDLGMSGHQPQDHIYTPKHKDGVGRENHRSTSADGGILQNQGPRVSAVMKTKERQIGF